jgi:cytochrome d ubiquinol oxidase subunit II
MNGLASLTLAEWTAGVIIVALNAYVLFAGADFGGGVWDLFASGPRREKQRELVAHAIGPIWEANHVWLIVVVVMLFVCFPPAFAAFGTLLHIPLSAMLVGIVLRGSAFVFRAYSYGPRSEQRRWGRVFAISSLITPVVLGMCVGALVSGDIGAALGKLGSANVTFGEVYIRPWLHGFSIAVGLMTLTLFSFLAAVYLTIEAGQNVELQEDFRKRALASAAAAMAAALLALVVGAATSGVMARFVSFGWTLAVLVASMISAIMSVVCLVRRRYQLARIAAGGWVTLVLWGWVLAQFPAMIPPSLTIDAAAAPRATIVATLAVLIGGGAVLIPSLWYLLRVFKGKPA